MLETGEAFAIRRVYAAAGKLRATKGAFARWELVRAAGLHPRLEQHPKIHLALDYECRPFVEVSFPSSAQPERPGNTVLNDDEIPLLANSTEPGDIADAETRAVALLSTLSVSFTAPTWTQQDAR